MSLCVRVCVRLMFNWPLTRWVEEDHILKSVYLCGRLGSSHTDLKPEIRPLGCVWPQSFTLELLWLVLPSTSLACFATSRTEQCRILTDDRTSPGAHEVWILDSGNQLRIQRRSWIWVCRCRFVLYQVWSLREFYNEAKWQLRDTLRVWSLWSDDPQSEELSFQIRICWSFKIPGSL